MAEYVYCITNPSMVNKIKSGGTAQTPEIRCDKLYNTSLPEKCVLAYYIKVNNFRDAEKYIHDKIIKALFKIF